MADIRIAQAAPAPAPTAGRGGPPPGFGRGPAHTGPVPALEFLDRIRQRSGVPSRPQTLDRVVAGDVTAEITGIACMALATFDGTVLTALRETETALSAYSHDLDRRTALKAARDEAERAATITRAQQHEGTVNSLDLLDAERTLGDSEAALADADAQIADDQINLFEALGGGWSA